MGVPAESTDDRFVRSDLLFRVHFDSLILGGLRTCLSDSSFFFFGHLFAVFCGWWAKVIG